eukprot:TRINITY_DN31683_c0_g1_i2.p1 TRINITY_DN31683_c0_g1~~TRINITY_DN31683_c0_g1_i2.p1  ORF type:complete len:134 (-),score=46.63 TRINITY_DN31683_c0_g1_i2:160-561(-)
MFFFFLMIRRPPRSTQGVSSAASDVYKRQVSTQSTWVANTIQKEFPKSSFSQQYLAFDMDSIAKELKDIAKNQAYKSIEEHEKPSENYIKNGYEQCKRLMALAGYRLGAELEKIIQAQDQINFGNLNMKNDDL